MSFSFKPTFSRCFLRAFLFSIVISLFCCVKKTSSTVKFEQRVVVGPGGNSVGQPGHEVLTWVALYNLHESDSRFFELPERALEKSQVSTDPFIHGDFATDFIKEPFSRTLSFSGLLEFYLRHHPLGVSRYDNEEYFAKWNGGKGKSLADESWNWKEWLFDQGLHPLHFMRDGRRTNNTRGSIAPLMDACLTSQAVIRNAYQKATDLYRNNRSAFSPSELELSADERLVQTKLWLGSGLHTIQDSFSPAHTYRDGGQKLPDPKVVTDLKSHVRSTCENGSCRYIREMCGAEDDETRGNIDPSTGVAICMHPSFGGEGEELDHIFDDWSKDYETFNIGYHMKSNPLAQMAVEASVRFLKTFHSHVIDGDPDRFEAFLKAEVPCCPANSSCATGNEEVGAVEFTKIVFPEDPQPVVK